MQISDIIFEDLSSSKLYHATKIEHYKQQLSSDSLMAAMIHRFWRNGHRLDSGDDGYDDHVWIKCLSLSRDLRFCLRWGFLVYELDRTKLNQKYKLLPVTWFSKKQVAHKRRHEAEEFLWVETSKLSGDGPQVIKYADTDLRVNNLHKYCTKLIISKFYLKGRSKDSLDEVESNCREYCDKYKIDLVYK